MREIINLKLHEPPNAITTFDGLSLYLESKITLAFFFLEIFFTFLMSGTVKPLLAYLDLIYGLRVRLTLARLN